MRKLSEASLIRLVSYCCACLVCVISFAVVVAGQANATGSISGTVTDPSGAVIVGADVTLSASGQTPQTVVTNSQGHFAFVNLSPGPYDLTISHTGFKTLKSPNNEVTINQTLNLKLALQIGAQTSTVEVNAAQGVQLQTLNATMSSTVDASTLLPLPSLNRDVNSVMNMQPTSAPTFHVEGDVTAGSVAGATPDQNTFILDGGTNTSGLEGDNGYINGFSGSQRGIVPTPIETIQQFTVNTNNMTADFATSSGGEVLASTKRGTNQWHGSGYEYFQGSWLNSNDWDNNRTGTPRPKSHQNRFGFDLGGTMLPRMLGGKTYFYFDYEGLRFPRNSSFVRTVPSDLLRQGIIQIRTSNGTQQFNLGNGTLAVCGTGTELCDPRQLGMSSAVSTIWNKYMPEPNDPTGGDRLNTFGYRGNLSVPERNNFMVGRFDHDFGSNWRFMGVYNWYKDYSPTANEVDIGGLLPGDTKGDPATASRNINQPRLIIAGLSGSFTPNLTNDFHFTYTRNQWAWLRNGVAPQLAGAPGVVEIGGESTNALIPINVDTQSARRRAWYEHDWDYRDELSWLKGNHLFQFGGDWLHEWWHFDRYDNVVGGLTTLIYEVDGGSLHMTPQYQPQACSATVTSQCLDAGDASELGVWNSYYADLLGVVNHSSVVATRSGSNLTLNPLGTPAASYVLVNDPDVYFSDAWHLTPNLTLSYGLNWGVQMPPYDLHGVQDVLVDQNNKPITYDSWIQQRQQAAANGQVYLPTVGFTPVGGLKLKYPFKAYYGELAPRVALAWNPNWSNWFAGDHGLVIRGGFARFYGRNFGINVISNPVLGDGFLQPVSCTGPTNTGQCLGQDKADPSTAFRLGSNADGLTAPVPALTPTLSTPVQPGVNAPYTVLTDSMDQNYRPNETNQWDFSIQRQFGRNTLLEVGYLGVWASHLFQGIDLNAVPYMMKQGGQTFSEAYANIEQSMMSGGAIYPQPFFEAALAGVPYCQDPAKNPIACGAPGANFPSYTAAVFANENGNFAGQNVTGLWSDLDSLWKFGPALLSTNQSFWTYADTSNGFSNYQALVIQWKQRAAKGLTLNANFTYGHALGTLGLSQTYTLDTPDNVYNLRSDWTPQPWDRKGVFNLLGTYELPFGQGLSNGFLKRIVGGWMVSPVITIATGRPLEVYTGGAEMGAGFAENGASAIPVGVTGTIPNRPFYGVTVPEGLGNPNSVAVNGNADNGGSNVNMFGNAAVAWYNHFRPFILGLDGSPSPDGNLRGLARWNVDLGVTKDTQITERMHAQAFVQAFNVFNKMEFNDPYLNIQDPADWGVLGSQYNTLNGSYTRMIQLGIRLAF